MGLYASIIFYLNVLKTKVKITRVVEDGKIVDVVASFIFLGAFIRRDGLCDKRYAYELQLAKLQWGIWKDGNQACHKSETDEGPGIPNRVVNLPGNKSISQGSGKYREILGNTGK